MKLGVVIGKVVASTKEGNLGGQRILAVRYLDKNLNDSKITTACIDTVNAGEGEVVILCSSSSARFTSTTRYVATDNTIVGIVDSITSGKEMLYKK
ncbi:MAG: EutN/CcmL family microcompartment protein [Bacteroidetes bacterium]|nr:EutN/CcmL family microcompartment protein [Bacteroidota bacterium]